MTHKPYDLSYLDIASRLRDDELITINLVNQAADIITQFGAALDQIEKFGHSHGHGHGYTCATMARKALDIKTTIMYKQNVTTKDYNK